MNKFIVRLTIFLTSIYFITVLIFAWNGIGFTQELYRPMLEYCLFILASEHPKYHCRFARFLVLNLCFTDTLSIVDYYFNLIPNAVVLLEIISISWIIAVSITIYLAIRHFKKVRELKIKKQNGI